MADPTFWSWSFDPIQLTPLALGAFFYFKRARTLQRRGTPVPAWRQWLFAVGIALLLLALASPIDELGEDRLFVFHMLQHVMLGDLAALALLVGVTGPVLRPLLALPAVNRLRMLAHPLVALPLWTLNLFVWHVPFLFEAALEHSVVHALQHVLFVTCGVLMWAPVIEILPAPAWFGTGAKLGYIVVVRLLETLLGNIFLWSGTVFYEPYDRAVELWGVSPLHDQGLAGTVMMLEGSLVTLAAFAWLFLRLAKEGELRQQLLEEGLDPRAVQRAVRYGRAGELTQRR